MNSCRWKFTAGSSCRRFRGWQGEICFLSVIASIHILNDFASRGTHWFSGTLRKLKRSGGNRKPGVCRAQAGWSGKLSSTFPFVSFHFPPIPSWMDKKHFKILILILLLHQMHRFWPHHPSSDDDKKKKRNGHPEGIPSIAYRLNFEEGSQTLVVTVLQCRCQKCIMASVFQIYDIFKISMFDIVWRTAVLWTDLTISGTWRMPTWWAAKLML